jgi:hypothetical protein
MAITAAILFVDVAIKNNQDKNEGGIVKAKSKA